MARAFAEERDIPFRLLVDPELTAYRTLDLRRSLGSAMSLGALRAGVRAYRSGYRQGVTQGDPLQQGGVLVLARGGEVVFLQRSEHAGDHPAEAEILDASRRAAALSIDRQRRASGS